MPKWGIINERRGQLHEVIRLSGMNIIINGTDHPLIIKVASIPVSRVQVYFIDNDDSFTRRAIERDAEGQLFDDNAERAVFYARGVLETVKKLRWTPDVIHCQGWMAGIIPLYIRQAYNDEPCFSDAKIVTSLYSRNMDGIMGENVKDSIAYKDINRETLAAYDDAFTMADMERLAVDYSDGIIEMTEGYNPEIIQYAKEKGKAVLAYPGESFVEKYREFYESL